MTATPNQSRQPSGATTGEVVATAAAVTALEFVGAATVETVAPGALAAVADKAIPVVAAFGPWVPHALASAAVGAGAQAWIQRYGDNHGWTPDQQRKRERILAWGLASVSAVGYAALTGDLVGAGVIATTVVGEEMVHNNLIEPTFRGVGRAVKAVSPNLNRYNPDPDARDKK